jgi:hypothetical protein
LTPHTKRTSRITRPPLLTDGGETTAIKVRDEEKGHLTVDPPDTAIPLAKVKAKVAKANQKEKANLLALPWATAAPNPAATVGKLDMSIENVANVSGMKNRVSRKRNLTTPTTLNMRLTSRWMRPP